MENEIFKPINGYEGIYEVSNLGRVKTLASNKRGKYKTDTIMKPFNNGRGYMYYSLNNGIKVKNISAHRLVANAFIKSNENNPDINHKNGIKSDNRVENLEWCSKKMNMIHASLNGLLPSGENCHFSKLKEDDIIRIKKLWGYNVKREIISDVFGISFAQISRIVNNKNWKHLTNGINKRLLA